MNTSINTLLAVARDASVRRDLARALPNMTVHASSHLGPSLPKELTFDIVAIELDLLRELCDTTDRRSLRTSFRALSRQVLGAPIIVLADRERERAALEMIRAGVHDVAYLPLDGEWLRCVISGVESDLLVESELEYLRDQAMEGDTTDFFTCQDVRMEKIFTQVKRVAATNSTVLITGETGTGKTILAQHIHLMGTRKDGPFISVHCGAIPETLLESELFGHEKGAFTGASRQKLGKFDIAKGGTIFLDEIGTVSPVTQIKLLQVLQDQTFSRIGGEETIHADVRIIAATNDDLLELTKSGNFRQDLYYRLNVFPVYMPPLRERMADLEIIANSILDRLSTKLNLQFKGIASSVMEAFRNYDWPGNVRELENVIERAMILEDTDTLTPGSFPTELFSTSGDVLLHPPLEGTLQAVRQRAIESLEIRYLEDLLERHSGKITAAAEEAGLGVRQINKLIGKYGLDRNHFR